MSKREDKGKEPKQQAKQQELMTYVQPRMKGQALTSNVSTATFSSMSKQAESLVNGGNNVVFNPYNNNLVFQWVSMSMNDCLSIDLINRALLNFMSLKFVSNGEIRGISDGFTVDEKGQIVQLYDPTIALSCAFGYKIQTESDERRGGSTLRLKGGSLTLKRC